MKQKKVRMSVERLRRIERLILGTKAEIEELTARAMRAEDLSRALYTHLAALVHREPDRELLILDEELEALRADRGKENLGWTMRQTKTADGLLLQRIDLAETPPREAAPELSSPEPMPTSTEAP